MTFFASLTLNHFLYRDRLFVATVCFTARTRHLKNGAGLKASELYNDQIATYETPSSAPLKVRTVNVAVQSTVLDLAGDVGEVGGNGWFNRQKAR